MGAGNLQGGSFTDGRACVTGKKVTGRGEPFGFHIQILIR